MKNAALKLAQNKRALGLTSVQMRAFGAPAPDPNHKYVMHKVDSQSTTYKLPSEGDMKYQLP